ncbi:17550_t:CDS:2, partial [Dentiscutata erythropus]
EDEEDKKGVKDIVPYTRSPHDAKQPKPTIFEAFSTYYIPEEPFKDSLFYFKEEPDLEIFFQNLAAICDTFVGIVVKKNKKKVLEQYSKAAEDKNLDGPEC